MEHSKEDRTSEHLGKCQWNAQNIAWHLKGIGTLMRTAGRDIPINPDDLSGIGEIILELATKTEMVGHALDCVAIKEANDGTSTMSDLFEIKKGRMQNDNQS